MKKIFLLLSVAMCVFSSCADNGDDFLLSGNPSNTRVEEQTPVPYMSTEEKWQHIPVIYDFRTEFVEKTWIEEEHDYWVSYSDVDGFDFGDYSDGTPDVTMDIRVDFKSYDLLRNCETPISAMYCRDCQVWHIYFEGYDYDD